MYQIKSYHEATTLDEAVELLADNSNAQIIAGGTDVLIKARERKEGYIDKDLVGIMRIPDIKGVRIDKDGTIFIGATTTFTEVENAPLVRKHLGSLSFAVGTVGGPQVRNTGTIGGNVCNGATSGDSASTLFVFNALVCITGEAGNREVPVEDFYQGPGKVDLAPGEILKGFKIREKDYKGYKGHYIKFSQRRAMDIATLGCSILLMEEAGIIKDLRIAFGVAGPTPIRAVNAEAFAKGKPVSNTVLKEIGVRCLENAKARDSWRASKAFREQLIKSLPKKAIEIALGGEGDV